MDQETNWAYPNGIVEGPCVQTKNGAFYYSAGESDPKPHNCRTCGAHLAPGHKEGNHVRGKQDESCDKCFSN